MKQCERCGVSTLTSTIHAHHVVGRVGKDKDNPENLINLCHQCHHEWHNNRSHDFEEFVYYYMKRLHGDKFPIKVNGHPRITKWIARIEQESKVMG